MEKFMIQDHNYFDVVPPFSPNDRFIKQSKSFHPSSGFNAMIGLDILITARETEAMLRFKSIMRDFNPTQPPYPTEHKDDRISYDD